MLKSEHAGGRAARGGGGGGWELGRRVAISVQGTRAAARA
jgi:hypothetical protein